MKKQIGIWIDLKEAYIIELGEEENKVLQLASEIEDYRLKGGSRSKVPYGPMEKTSESKHLERRKQQMRRFFKRVVDKIAEADEFFIFGPAEAKVGLNSYIEEFPLVAAKLKAVETADAMTANQKVAAVKKFFKR